MIYFIFTLKRPNCSLQILHENANKQKSEFNPIQTNEKFQETLGSLLAGILTIHEL